MGSRKINFIIDICMIGIFILTCDGQVCNAEVISKRLSDYSIIEERNIFAPPKAPSPVTPPETPVPEVKPVPKEVAAKKVTEVERMLLTGIVFFDNKFHVLLEDKATSKGAILTKGEVINGVSIIDIEEGKVLLQKAGEKLEMVLERKSKETGFPPVGMLGPGSFWRGPAGPQDQNIIGGGGILPSIPPPPGYPYQNLPGAESALQGITLPEEIH